MYACYVESPNLPHARLDCRQALTPFFVMLQYASQHVGREYRGNTIYLRMATRIYSFNKEGTGEWASTGISKSLTFLKCPSHTWQFVFQTVQHAIELNLRNILRLSFYILVRNTVLHLYICFIKLPFSNSRCFPQFNYRPDKTHASWAYWCRIPHLKSYLSWTPIWTPLGMWKVTQEIPAVQWFGNDQLICITKFRIQQYLQTSQVKKKWGFCEGHSFGDNQNQI